MQKDRQNGRQAESEEQRQPFRETGRKAENQEDRQAGR
jgi:hypothetical protein